MLKKRDFWVGFLVGGVVLFFYAWLSIWATYTELERGHLKRESELNAVRKIIFYSYDIHSQYEEGVEWNLQKIKPVPELVEAKEAEQ